MSEDDTLEALADLYQVLGALMDRWDELGIEIEHMDALIDVQLKITKGREMQDTDKAEALAWLAQVSAGPLVPKNTEDRHRALLRALANSALPDVPTPEEHVRSQVALAADGGDPSLSMFDWRTLSDMLAELEEWRLHAEEAATEEGRSTSAADVVAAYHAERTRQDMPEWERDTFNSYEPGPILMAEEEDDEVQAVWIVRYARRDDHCGRDWVPDATVFTSYEAAKKEMLYQAGSPEFYRHTTVDGPHDQPMPKS